ncbi:hypothetical protein AZE42_13751 [Rhizopogon vesiculosus]|uniref:Uncharacterized protein n=1 Tax=Rhizopogon vesiculosus TaxID=180088 RepID=A0A1J8QU65_9AGAM|nr:hypothetical protein AZE42_13751 [Rhizopogon vesiculosus]
MQSIPADSQSSGGSSPVKEDEIDRAAVIIAYAIANPYCVPWDVDRYAKKVKSPSSQKGVTEWERLAKVFEMTKLGRISEPATIVDIHGKILVWYLPNIMSPWRVNFVNNATAGLWDLLLKSIPNESKAKKAWRSDGFLMPDGGGKFGAGCLKIPWL